MMNSAISRRRFLGAAAAATAPLILPGRVLGLDGATSPNNKVRMAAIGVGGQGFGDMSGLMGDERVQMVAVCDVDAGCRARAAKSANLKENDVYKDYREVLARKDVDAVLIATPDHWHAVIATAAAAAGKDLYSEKPLAASIGEGRAMCEAVKKYKRVLQCGTWRRSGMKTRLACEWALNGYIGEVREILVGVPGKFAISGGYTGLEPEQPVPPSLDYEMWQGPAPAAPYTAGRVHFNFRWVNDYAPGYITDWGAHFLDVAQWGSDRDETSPTEISATEVKRREKGYYDAPESFRVEYHFAKGPRIVMFSTTDSKEYGVKFVGSEGWVFTEAERLEQSDAKLRSVKFKDSDKRLFVSNNHFRNFIDAVISRGRTAAPADIAQRAATMCHLGTISAALKRPVKYDPAAESFADDKEAAAMHTRKLRGDWKLTV
jgi:predicted dehydrogenase